MSQWQCDMSSFDRPNFSEPNSSATGRRGKFPGDELAAVFQTPQRVFQHAGPDGRGADHQRAIGHGLGDGRIFAGLFQHGVRFHGRASFAEGDGVGIHQTKFGEAEVAHGAGGGPDIERIARRNQDDFERAHGVFG